MTYMWLYGSKYLFRAVYSTKLPGGSIVHIALFTLCLLQLISLL